MRIGITGASGMLGTVLVSQISKSHEVFATSRSKGLEEKNIEWDCFDLTDYDLLNIWLDKIKPDLIIHCAAIVNVDLCEENVDLATALHVETTRVIVDYLNITKGRLIYISTDSVFNGEKSGSYSETDIPNPLNVYAKTKLQGEKLAQSMVNGLALRTNIIGWKHKGNDSFVEWMLKSLVDNQPLNLFHDVYFSPLTVEELSFIIEKIIHKPIFGLYNCASSDNISKYDFGKKMSEIFQLSGSNINSVSVDIMNFKATRPKNMALDVSKISLDLAYNPSLVVESIKLIRSQYEKNRVLK
jgi:dTDP-4-dehydrorhamnose reductase